MDSKLLKLAACGYEIVWTSGEYCRACREQRDVLLRWDGSGWRLL